MNILTEKEICYKIYCEAFGADEFSVELFESCYKYCRFFKVDEQIVSIMFLLPCEIVCKERSYTAKYVFAVSTAKEHRGKGYMSDFINSVDDDTVFFLKPASDDLIEFYKARGYKTFTAVKSRVGERYVKPCDDFLKLAEKITVFNNEKYIAMYRYKEKLDLDNLCFSYTME